MQTYLSQKMIDHLSTEEYCYFLAYGDYYKDEYDCMYSEIDQLIDVCDNSHT